MRKVFLTSFLFLTAFSALSQNEKGYFKIGYNISNTQIPILDTFAHDFNLSKKTGSNGLDFSGPWTGLILAIKATDNRLSMEFGLDGKRIKSGAEGLDSFGNRYNQKIRIRNDKVYLAISYNLTGTGTFSLEPGVCLDGVWFIGENKNLLYPHSLFRDISRTFFIGTTLYADLGIGKNNTFTIRPFYQFGFWNTNIYELENYFIPKKAKAHDKSYYSFRSVNWGFAMHINFLMGK